MRGGNTIHYISLGSSERIGPSAHYLRLGDWGVLLDAGLDPAENSGSRLPDFDLIADQPVNAIILSHAHLDHLGALPVAVRYFPHARIYMTPASAALAEPLLFHYLKVQRKKALEERVPNQASYTESDVEQILYLFQSFPYNFPFRIHGFQQSDIEIEFWDAGHILGSAGVEIRWRGRRIFYTGNTRRSAQFLMKGARYPAGTDILITESTYGANAEAPGIKKSREVKRFAKFLSDRLKLNGSILIPVFALGRTQEMLTLVHRLLQTNQIPAVPIYITGFGISINRIYDRLMHKIYPSDYPQKLKTISTNTLRGKHFRQPAVILATSGMMLRNTLSYEIARDFLETPRNGIAFVGWADPETPGGSLRARKADKIRAVFAVESIACAVETFYFSAHSHREELLAMIRRLRPKATILCHGEQPAREWLRDRITKTALSERVLLPAAGEWYRI